MFSPNATSLTIMIRHTLRKVQENLRSFMRYTNNEDKNEMQDLMLYIKYLSGIKNNIPEITINSIVLYLSFKTFF